MFNSILMQFKREFWEHKSIMFTLPMVFAVLVSGVFTLGASYYVLTDQIHFRSSGEVEISDNTSRVNWILNSAEIERAQKLEVTNHSFSVYDNDVTREFPELLWDEDPALAESDRNNYAHIYKRILQSQMAMYNFAVDYLLLLFIFVPVIASVLSDRKDRSVLFWRSIPVSETQTILTKFVSAVIVLPLIYYIFLCLTALIIVSVFTLVEWVQSASDTLEISMVLWKAMGLFMVMAEGLIFRILWFSPVYALVMLLFAQRYVLLAVCSAVLILVISIFEPFLIGSKFILEGLKNYYAIGNDIGWSLRWGKIWENLEPEIPYQNLGIVLIVSMFILLLAAQVRRKQDI